MIVEDVFSKMNNILHDYNKTHDFSGTNNHVFLVTPIVRQLIKESYMCGPEGHTIKTLMYRGYSIWESANNSNDRLILFAEVHHAINSGCLFDESPMWKYFKERKEVKKTMAIDYGKEWQKLHKSTGHCTVVKNNTGTTLNVIMDTQIRETIDDRERLMKEYLVSGMEADITGGDKVCYWVTISFRRSVYTTIKLIKRDFEDWCKKRMKGGK